MTVLDAEVVFVCESAMTVAEWQAGRREIETFSVYTTAWERMNEHLRAGRSAFCSETIALGQIRSPEEA